MSNLLAGLVQGYNDSRNRELERVGNEEMKKLQVKMFKMQLEDQEQRKAAKGQLIDFLSQNPEIGGAMGFGIEQPQPQATPQNLLSSPKGQALLLQMGADPREVMSMGKTSIADEMARMQMELMRKTMGGGQSGGMGDLKLSGLKFGPDGRPMFDFSIPESEKIKEKAAAELENERNKRAAKSVEMLNTIYEAEDLLDKASGGLAETAIAKGKGIANISDETTQANEQLNLLSGWLVANVPRMEGPQSEFDVKNYQQMAGKVGDSTVPVGDRKAALKQLVKLQKKYAGINGAQSRSPSNNVDNDDPLNLRNRK